MNKIDRLILRANELAKVNKYAVDILFIERAPECGLWRVHGSYLYRATKKAAGDFDKIAGTLEAAEEIAAGLAEKYPPVSGDLTMFICDDLEE